MLLLFLILLISGCGGIDHIEIGGEKIRVETADTQIERERGLMFRKNLCEDCGMLFVFEEEDFHNFWMKNTLMPLDMIFIDSDLNIIDILRAEPCVEDSCELYIPKDKSLYVLEVNGGKFDKGIVGEKMRFE